VEGVKESDEVLARLGAGVGDREDGGLAVGEDVRASESGVALDDVQREYCSHNFCLEDRMLTLGAQVLRPAFPSLPPFHDTAAAPTPPS
jgi:hypothetical protein